MLFIARRNFYLLGDGGRAFSFYVKDNAAYYVGDEYKLQNAEYKPLLLNYIIIIVTPAAKIVNGGG